MANFVMYDRNKGLWTRWATQPGASQVKFFWENRSFFASLNGIISTSSKFKLRSFVRKWESVEEQPSVGEGKSVCVCAGMW